MERGGKMIRVKGYDEEEEERGGEGRENEGEVKEIRKIIKAVGPF